MKTVHKEVSGLYCATEMFLENDVTFNLYLLFFFNSCIVFVLKGNRKYLKQSGSEEFNVDFLGIVLTC